MTANLRLCILLAIGLPVACAVGLSIGNYVDYHAHDVTRAAEEANARADAARRMVDARDRAEYKRRIDDRVALVTREYGIRYNAFIARREDLLTRAKLHNVKVSLIDSDTPVDVLRQLESEKQRLMEDARQLELEGNSLRDFEKASQLFISATPDT